MPDTVSIPGTMLVDAEGGVYFVHGGLKSSKVGHIDDFDVPYGTEDGVSIQTIDQSKLEEIQANFRDSQVETLRSEGVSDPDSNKLVRLFQAFSVLLVREDDGENLVTAADAVVDLGS